MQIKKFPKVAIMATKLNFFQYNYRFRINHKTLYSQTFPGPHFGSISRSPFDYMSNALSSPYTLLDMTWVGVSQHTMMKSSNGNIFHVTGHLCGEFTGHRWISCTKASDVELWCFLWSAPEVSEWVIKFTDLSGDSGQWGLNKHLSKQWWGWWFETPSCPLWRHCNDKPKLSGYLCFLCIWRMNCICLFVALYLFTGNKFYPRPSMK